MSPYGDRWRQSKYLKNPLRVYTHLEAPSVNEWGCMSFVCEEGRYPLVIYEEMDRRGGSCCVERYLELITSTLAIRPG